MQFDVIQQQGSYNYIVFGIQEKSILLHYFGAKYIITQINVESNKKCTNVKQTSLLIYWCHLGKYNGHFKFTILVHQSNNRVYS